MDLFNLTMLESLLVMRLSGIATQGQTNLILLQIFLAYDEFCTQTMAKILQSVALHGYQG